MANDMSKFSSNLTEVLDAITDSKIYTDMQAMYDESRLQKDQHDKIIIAFHEKALGVATEMALKGYRIDEIMQKELDLKSKDVELKGREILLRDEQIKTETARTALVQTQERGFLDNRIVEWADKTGKVVSMIQGGGNEAPQEAINNMFAAQAALANIASNHPEFVQNL